MAALLTPRHVTGELDTDAFERSLEFVLAHRVSGVCINGATGDYVITTPEEKAELLALAHRVVKHRGRLICGVGAARLSDCVALGQQALAIGADAVLVPPPHFFQYSQSDIEAFYTEAARQIAGPVLIYNLPAFTNSVGSGLALKLIESNPNIVGIKDSSGNLCTLELLTQRNELEACRIVGHDAVISRALRSKVCDGAISGIAGVLPELIVAVFESHSTADLVRADFFSAKLNELLVRLEEFPAPWGLKLIAECRGFHEAQFPLPLSDSRAEQVRLFARWFSNWLAALT